MLGHTSRAELSATLPLRHLDYPPKQTSFTSASSSEACTDAANTSQDTVDAVPLRIQRMPLLNENYTKQRQASEENSLSSRTPSNYSPQPSGRDTTDLGEENISLEGTETDKLLSSPSSFDYSKTSIDQEPDSYNELSTSNARSKTLMSATPRFYSNGQRNEIPKPTNGMKNTNAKCTTNGDTSPKRTTQMPTAADSTQQCEHDEDSNTTEVDLAARRQPKPFLKDASLDHNTNQSKDDQNPDQRPQQSAVISTPPRTSLNQDYELPEYPTYCCCDNTCTRLCIALLYWKTLCERFSLWDILATIISVAIFVFDVVTDLILSLMYYHKIVENEEYRFFFGLTLGLVIGPSVIVQCFSFFWVYDDYRHKNERLKRERSDKENMQDSESLKYIIKLFLAFILHLFQMAILFRYARVLLYGFRSRYNEVNKKKSIWHHYDTLWKYEVHDLNMLRLLESFLESAPQLVLQLYIVFMTKEVELITVISCVGSLLALSTMMVSIQRAIRNSNPKKNQLSILASVIMFFWRVFTISSRVLAFALFLTIEPLAFLGFILLHWIVATVWIALKGTNFCTKKAAEFFFNAICGLIYIFCFFNVHEEKEGRSSRSRWRMLIFYLVVLAENSICSILWYFLRPGGDTRPINFQDLYDSVWQRDEINSTPATFVPSKSAAIIQPAYALGIIVAVHVFFLFGIVFMIFYYAFLHPRRTDAARCFSKPKHQDRRRFNADERGTELVSAPTERLMLRTTPPHQVAQSISTPVTSFGAVISTPTMSQLPHSSAMQPGSSHSLQKRQKAQETLRWHQMIAEAEGSDSDTNAPWSETLFNRGRRAQKLYTRQYSREKELDNGNDLLPPTKTRTRRYSPRQTDGFEAVVTPSHEKPTPVRTPVSRSSTERAGSSRHSYRSTKVNPKQSAPLPMQRPGSRGPSAAPRSATHQILNSDPLESPTNRPVKITPPHAINTSPERTPIGCSGELSMPRPVENSGYNASMSGLVQEKSSSYVAPRRRARNREVQHTSSTALQEDKVVVIMETSV